MNILITSGSTNHFIDNTNFISHVSDGALGANIGEEFSKYPEVERIFYICGKNSAYPWQHLSPNDSKFFLDAWSDKISIYPISDAEEILEIVEGITAKHEISAFIQLMSIANYAESKLYHLSTTEDAVQLIEKIAKDFDVTCSVEQTEPASYGLSEKDVTSGYKRLFIEQKPTKKILKSIADMCAIPVTISSKMGYELSEEELVRRAHESLSKNKTAAVIAVNLNENQKEREDVIYIIQRDGSYQRIETSDLVAETMVEYVLQHAK